MTDSSFEPGADRAARALLDGSALVRAEDPANSATWPTYAGSPTPVSIEPLRCLGDPGATAILAATLANSVRSRFQAAEALIAIDETSSPWAVLASSRLGLPCGFFDCNSHAQTLQADFPHERSTILITDNLTLGAAVAQSIKTLRDRHGCSIVGVQALLSADHRSAWEIEVRSSVPFARATTVQRVLKDAVRRDLLEPHLASEVLRFTTSPTDHEWDAEVVSPSG